MKRILITGVTGFIGSVLCKQLMEEDSNYFYLLARGKGKMNAKERVFRQLEVDTQRSIAELEARVRVFESDLSDEDFGLRPDEYRELTENVTEIFHCAASIKFSLSYEEAKQINCMGTAQIVTLTERIMGPNFERLNYISTSYIAGSITEGFAETDLDCGQGFNNTYEQTKYECEMLLQSCIRRGVPITIYRPSIVTGSSRDGFTHRNNIIYKFMKMIRMGAVKAFYCEEDTAVNMVPVDYVVDGILALSDLPETLGETYNLVNAVNTNVKQSIETVCNYFKIERPGYVGFSQMPSSGEDSLYHFFNYARLSHHFQDEMTRDILKEHRIVCCNIDKDYFHKNLVYCIENGLLKGEKTA